jgi:ribosomal-protein-alanine N-acetyltransferase
MTYYDIEPVMAIENECYEFPWTKGIMSDCLRVGYHCYVYEVDNEIRGYVIFSTVLDEVHLLNICLAPEYQGRGLGNAFLHWLMNHARTLKYKTMYLEVRLSNQAAIHLYQKMGFNETGIRRNYYPAKNGKEDAQLFACELELFE